MYLAGMPNVKSIVQGLLRRGLSQRKLAALLGCSQAQVSRLASGRSREPKWALMRRIEQLSDQR